LGEAERIGTRIGNAAHAALMSTVPLAGNPAPITRRVVIPLARRALPDAVEARAAVTFADAAYQRALAEGAPAAALRILRTHYEGALVQERERETGGEEADIPVAVTLWRLGPLALAALPGELFSS